MARVRHEFLWNFASFAIMGVCGVGLTFALVRVRDASALGVFNQAFSLCLVLSQLAAGGLQFSILHFGSRSQRSDREFLDALSGALACSVLLSAVVAAGLVFASSTIAHLLSSPSVHAAILLSAPGLFCFGVNKVLLSAINSKGRIRAFAVFQAARYAMLFGFTVFIAFGPLQNSWLLLAFSATEILLLAGMLVYVRGFLFRSWPGLAAISREWVRRHALFGMRSMVSGFLLETNVRIDILMLGYFMSDAMVGVYALAAAFAEGFGQVSTVLRQVLDPRIGASFEDGRAGEIEELARRTRKRFVPLAAVLGTGLVACFPLILNFIGEEQGIQGAWPVLAILVSAHVACSGYRPLLFVLMQGGKPGIFASLIAAGVIVNCCLNIFLIPLLGINGAALATAVAIVLETIGLVALAWRFFHIRIW